MATGVATAVAGVAMDDGWRTTGGGMGLARVPAERRRRSMCRPRPLVVVVVVD